jgi:hypothetical protein
VWAIEATDMAQLDAFELLPEPLARMQFRGIGRQTLQGQPLCRPIRQELLDTMAAVDGGAVSDDDHLAGDLAQQVLEKPDDVVRIEGAVLAVEVELALGRQGADGGEMITRPPLSQDGCLPHRSIGAHHAGQGINPGLVYEEEALLLLLRPPLRAGQVCSRPCAMAASSRCRARRAGCWGSTGWP